MTDKYQTQCPHCGVKFQITAQQLALANGTVRCGSCLQVFQAGKNMVPMSSAPPPAGVGSARRPATAVPAAAAPAKQPPAQQTPTKAAPPPPTARPPSRPAPAPTAEPQWAAPPPPKKPAVSKPRQDIEENKLHISIGAGEISQQLLDDDDPFAVSGSSTLEPITDNDTAAADESWARDLMGEGASSEEDERVRKFQIKADDLSMVDRTGVEKKSALQERLARMTPAPPTAPPPQKQGTHARSAPTPRRTEPDARDEDEFDFLNESDLALRDIELPGLGTDSIYTNAIHTHEVNWSRNGFWGTLSAVFALILCGQYLAFNFDTLARDDDWRGVYAAACSAAGCELPGNSAVNRIQGANLVVRSHPTADHALIVDAVVYNRAPFAQPFPRLEVSFSDTLGQPVAGRIFSPAEYLSGELSANDLMPSNTPIHLTLELVDPDIAAMNYEVRFLPPDAS